MKKTKAEKGITLIVLAITVIVLLILAAVTIKALQDHGIIGHTKQAKKASIEAEEKDQIGLALSEWVVTEAKPNPPTFEEFLKEKFGEDNVVAGSEEGEWLVTFPETGNQYKVKEDGTIEKSKGISISPSSLTLTLKEGETVKDTITATLHEIEGNADDITWESTAETVATIDLAKGATITVTAVAAGETTITATSGEYSATCQVTVKEEQHEQEIAIGDFVEYNVTYTDPYIKKQYTAQNGWRYLGPDPDKKGNSLIISTGIPARLYYHYNDIDTPTDNNKWYITNESTLNRFRSVLGSSYAFYTGTSTYYSLQASAGLYYNFGDIKFAYGTSDRGYSLGYFTEISNKGTTYGSSNATEVTGKDLFISQEAETAGATVRLLTLPEVNKAVGNKDDIDQYGSGTITAANDPTGLYKLDKLKTVSGMNEYDYGSIGSFWLASPYTQAGDNYSMFRVLFNGSVDRSNGDINGVRPVISLPSSVINAPAK